VFHAYSIGNQILAAVQLLKRGLTLSPIASFGTWKEQGRFVMKGQRAITLCMPVNVKAGKQDPLDATAEPDTLVQVFRFKANWFSLEQTEGTEFTPELRNPTWDATQALSVLDIRETPFEDLRGNCMGYASGRTLAINPLNPLKHKTRFHELAHIVLGHTEQGLMSDEAILPPAIEEAEAEGVAYILCTLLNLPGQPESRGYIQSWLDGAALPEKNARRIFAAADKIMKAGQVT
jgi:hypothetical protein